MVFWSRKSRGRLDPRATTECNPRKASKHLLLLAYGGAGKDVSI